MARTLTFALAIGLGLGAGLGGAALKDHLLPAPPAVAAAAAPEPERTGPMDRRVMLALVRSTLTAVDQAGRTGNYAVLRALGSPDFQAGNTEEGLSRTFAGQRAKAPDLSGVLFTEPSLTIPPRLEANGMLRVAGFFPAGRGRLDFDLLYQPVEGRWRLFGISTGARTVELAAAAAPR